MRWLFVFALAAMPTFAPAINVPRGYGTTEAVPETTEVVDVHRRAEFSFPGEPGPTPGPDDDDKCDWAVFHESCLEDLHNRTACMLCAEHGLHDTPCSADQAAAFCAGEAVEECVKTLYETCFHHIEESDDCMEVCSSACIAQNTSLTPAEGHGAACTAEDHNNQASLTGASCQAFCLCFDGLRDAVEDGEEEEECRDVSATCLTVTENGTEVPDFTAYDEMVEHLCEMEEEEENEFNLKLRILLVIAGVLIALTIMFEMVEEFLTDLINKDFLPILQHVYSELTILGFVGLIMFILTKSGVLQSYSKSMFFHPPPGDGSSDGVCDEEEREAEAELTELVEGAHMVLFFVMICFLTQIGIMLWMTQRRMSTWRRWEAAHAAPKDIDDNDKEIACVKAIAHHMAMMSVSFFHKVNPLNWYRLKQHERKRLYLALRHGFVHPTRKSCRLLKQKAAMTHNGDIFCETLPSDFAFYKYLNKIMAANLLEIVQVENITWFFVATFFLVFWILIRFIDERTDILFFCMVGAVWVLLAFLSRLNVDMKAIAEQLCPRHLHNAAKEQHEKIKRHVSGKGLDAAAGTESLARTSSVFSQQSSTSIASRSSTSNRSPLLQTPINDPIYEDTPTVPLSSEAPDTVAANDRRGSQLAQRSSVVFDDKFDGNYSYNDNTEFHESRLQSSRISVSEFDATPTNELHQVGDESSRKVHHESGRVYPNCGPPLNLDNPIYHMKEKIPHGGQIESPFWRWAYGLRKKTDVIDRHTRLLPGKLAGPEYVKSALRISLLLVSMFVGVSLQVFLLDVINGDGHFDGYTGSTRGVVLTLAVLPPVLLIYLVLDISSHLAMACKTELLKDSKVVSFVLEIMKVTRVIQKLIPVAEAMMAHAEAAGHEDPNKRDPAHHRYKPTADEDMHHQAHEDLAAVLVRASASADHMDDSGSIWLDRDMVAKAMMDLDLLPHTLLKQDGNLSPCSWTGPKTTEWINEQLVEMGCSGGPESCVTLDDLKTHIYTIIHDIQSHHTNNKHAGLVDFIWKVIREDSAGVEDEDDDEDKDEGGVKAETLQAVFAKYGVEISVGEIEDIIHSVDKDGDGMINKEEFHALLKLAEIGEDG